MNYYNDNDSKACAWLRELISAGELPPGDVDERSITEISADDLAQYDQCHFFAGIGGWPLAMRWAGLANATGIWTGSCPCQPFSCAGRGKGTEDERHLWPVFRDLIRACRPAVVFGEQVASAAVVGKVGRGAEAPAVPVWLDGVRTDVETAGYAFGAAVLGAHSVGAPHRRQRLYWVADANGGECGQGISEAKHTEVSVAVCGGTGGVADSRLLGSSRSGKQAAGGEKCCGIGGLANADGNGLQPGERDNPSAGYGDTFAATCGDDRPQQPREADGCWDAVDWLFCRDGKWRPVESGTFPLAHGLPGRVGLLRGAGNAIVPQVAAEFIVAWLDAR